MKCAQGGEEEIGVPEYFLDEWVSFLSISVHPTGTSRCTPTSQDCNFTLVNILNIHFNRKYSFKLFVVVWYTCSVSYQLVLPSLAQCYSNLALF